VSVYVCQRVNSTTLCTPTVSLSRQYLWLTHMHACCAFMWTLVAMQSPVELLEWLVSPM